MDINQKHSTELYRVQEKNARRVLLLALKKRRPASIEICHIEGFLRKTDFQADLRGKKLSLVKSRGNLKIMVNSKQKLSFKISTVSNCSVGYVRVDEEGDMIIGNRMPQENPDDPTLPRVGWSNIFIASVTPVEFLMWISFEGKLPIEKDPDSTDDYPFCYWLPRK